MDSQSSILGNEINEAVVLKKENLRNQEDSLNESAEPILTRLELPMINQAVSTMGISVHVSRGISRLISQSKSVKQTLPDGAQLHCFVSYPISSLTNERDSLQVFPLQSNLFHESLVSSNHASASTSQALRDAFLVAQQNRETDGNSNLRCRTITNEEIRSDSPPVDEVLPVRRDSGVRSTFSWPTWFPYLSSEKETPIAERETEYIICRGGVMPKLASLDSTKLSKLYSNISKQFGKRRTR